MALLSICLFGPFEARLGGEPLSGFASDKVRALLIYLATESGRPHRREKLAGLLWPDFPERSARTNLRNALANLRKVLEEQARSREREAVPPFLECTRQTVEFAGHQEVWLDTHAFEGLVAVALDRGALEEAVGLVRGDFAEGFTLADAAPFEEWLLLLRESFRRRVAEALERLAGICAQRGDYEAALVHARRWVDLEPWQEDGQRNLMRLLIAVGRRTEALAHYEAHRRLLAEELGVEPAAETQMLFEAIHSGALAPEPGSVSNLPAAPTTFVGRQSELSEIARLLSQPDCRLLTLTGPGGVGKSRLAIEAAGAQARLSTLRYPHGVHFVALASVSDDDLLVPTVASAIGFAFYPREDEDSKQQLLNYLSDKKMLLILDSFDQLTGSSGLLADLLAGAPGLKLLVTSRERLNLRHEWLIAVPGMGYPDVGTVEPLQSYGATELFLQRAAQVDPAFQIANGEIAHLIRICRLVDGLPLGIELSAAWVRMLSCREIADEIERSLDFLSTSMRDLPSRHRSLRAVCDQSWARLTEEERRAFQRLSVFRGGFQLEAAEHVAGAGVPLLSSLLDKSLLRRERCGRYEMHEVLNQYAAEKLGQSPADEVDARHRHCAYYAGFLQHREEALKGAGQLAALGEIDAELQNVRAAWGWSLTRGEVAEITRAAHSLWLFFEMQSLLEEGEQAFARAVDVLEGLVASGPEARVALGLARAFRGRFCGRLYRFDEATDLLEQSQADLRRMGARKELALANSLCFFPGADERFPDAEPLLQESLAIFRGLGDRWGVAFALSRFLWSTRHSQEERRYLDESLAIARELGDRWTVGLCLLQLGDVLQAAGELREAMQRNRESQEVFRELGDRLLEQISLDHIGYLARWLGEYDDARQHHLASLAVSREGGDRLGTAGSLDNLGLVARDLGDYDEAERYLQEGLAIRQQVGNQWAISISLAHLGDVALAQGRYAEARRCYQESLSAGRDLEPQDTVGAARGLAQVLAAQGDYEQARRYLRTALELDTAGDDVYVPQVLQAVVGLAELTMRTGKSTEPAEWAAYVASHLGSPATTRERAEALLDGLASRMSSQAMEMARQRGRDSTLTEVLQSVMGEL